MDQAQTRALAALQPFIHLAVTTKSPSHRFLADLINRATSASGTYVFTELLQTPAIQSLHSESTPPEFRACLTHLEIFSYGTYDEYQNTPDLPSLSEAQATKLRQLTLLTVSSSPTTPLTYANLLSTLNLSTPAALESLITSSIYSGLLTARLSPTSDPPQIHITSVAPLRDLRPLSLPTLLNILSTWSSRCDSVISSLSTQIETIKTDASKRAASEKRKQDIVDAAVNGPAETADLPRSTAPVLRSKKGSGHGPKRSLEDQEEDDGYDDFIDDVSGGDDLGMELDEPVVGSSFGAGGVGRGGKGNKKSRGKLHS